ncbi:MAG: hypothetical protein AAFN12_11580 [Cyanobacteria bacterium J06560_2]
MILSKLHTLSWLILNLGWSTLIGLLLPRTPSFGRPILAATIPFMLYGIFVISERNTTEFTQAGKVEPTTDSEERQKHVPPWVYGSVTLGLTLKNIIQAVVNESLIKFLSLGVLLGWAWFEITWRNAAYFHSFLGRKRSFPATLGISTTGLAIGLVIYSIRREQVFSLFLTLIVTSLLALITISCLETASRSSEQ